VDRVKAVEGILPAFIFIFNPSLSG